MTFGTPSTLKFHQILFCQRLSFFTQCPCCHPSRQDNSETLSAHLKHHPQFHPVSKSPSWIHPIISTLFNQIQIYHSLIISCSLGKIFVSSCLHFNIKHRVFIIFQIHIQPNSFAIGCDIIICKRKFFILFHSLVTHNKHRSFLRHSYGE